MGVIDAIEQHRELGGVELHAERILGQLREAEAPLLEPLVTRSRMQMLLSQGRALCGSRTLFTRSADNSSPA
jgi:hypothetical protein